MTKIKEVGGIVAVEDIVYVAKKKSKYFKSHSARHSHVMPNGVFIKISDHPEQYAYENGNFSGRIENILVVGAQTRPSKTYIALKSDDVSEPPSSVSRRRVNLSAIQNGVIVSIGAGVAAVASMPAAPALAIGAMIIGCALGFGLTNQIPDE